MDRDEELQARHQRRLRQEARDRDDAWQAEFERRAPNLEPKMIIKATADHTISPHGEHIGGFKTVECPDCKGENSECVICGGHETLTN